jgi:hypothetical protein
MEEKGMKGKLNGLKKKLLPAGMGSMMAVMLMNTTCFAAAAGTSAVTQPLENLKTLVIAVIGAVGVIILAKTVMEFAQAYQQHQYGADVFDAYMKEQKEEPGRTEAAVKPEKEKSKAR